MKGNPRKLLKNRGSDYEARVVEAFPDDFQGIKNIRVFQRLIEKDIGINREEHRPSPYLRDR